MSPTSATFHPSEVAHEIVSWLSEGLKGVSTIDYVLLGLALVIVYFLRKSLVAVTRVGQVEVELLECDAGNKAEVHALTAALRERLANSGLPAPVVPSGTPQAGLISAIAASPLPQGAFIAKLVEALPIPEPTQYKLSGTLFEKNNRPGISIWLRPSSKVRPLMRTIEGAPHSGEADYEELIKSSAFEIYSFISTQAVQAFPAWARWHSAKALADYRSGLDAAGSDCFTAASAWLGSAAYQEPDNALVWLQLANVYERIAYPDAEGAARSAAISANWQAKTLRRYLWIADQWPWLVQARYRASVLAGALAGSCEAGQEAIIIGARSGLGLPDDADVEAVLTSIAKSESDFVLQLLKPWYMLVRWRRSRSQFEPSAEERRALKRAVGISRQALRVRRLPSDDGWRVRLLNGFSVAWSELVVRCWHLSLGLIALDWQTQYVAACFDSLLLGYATRRFPKDAQAAREVSPSPGGLVARRRRWWLKHLRKHAFRRLDRAISEAGRSLPSSWVLDEDPDMQPLRELHDEWEAETGALRTQTEVAASELSDDFPAEPASSPAARVPLLRSPTRPWPKPGLRVCAYAALGVTTAVLAAVLGSEGWEWLAVFSASFVLCVWRAFLAAREQSRRRTITGALYPGAVKAGARRAARLP